MSIFIARETGVHDLIPILLVAMLSISFRISLSFRISVPSTIPLISTFGVVIYISI